MVFRPDVNFSQTSMARRFALQRTDMYSYWPRRMSNSDPARYRGESIALTAIASEVTRQRSPESG